MGDINRFSNNVNYSLNLLSYYGVTANDNKLNQIKNLRINRPKGRKIQAIFKTYWYTLKPLIIDKLRESIISNVEKMIKCHDLGEGYLFYECTNCNNYHLTGLSCHSRFCPTCNQKYRLERTTEMQKKLLNVKHRHFVFSIPQEIRSFFRIERDLLNILFNSVNSSFNMLIRSSKKKKRERWTPGIISVIHTYGRDLKWNPHIHALVAERVYDCNNKFYKYDYFHFNRLRRIYQFKLLNSIRSYLKNTNKKLYNKFIPLSRYLVKRYPDGFYTYGPEIDDYEKDGEALSAKAVSEYIARYASHPPIAESRIIDINYDTDMVTWVFDPHEDDNKEDNQKLGTQTITEHVFEFMKKLIVHIPDKGFHSIRYQGFYANRSKIDTKNYKRLYSEYYIYRAKRDSKWERMLVISFKYTPLLCPCGHTMILNLSLSFLPVRTRGPTYETTN